MCERAQGLCLSLADTAGMQLLVATAASSTVGVISLFFIIYFF